MTAEKPVPEGMPKREMNVSVPTRKMEPEMVAYVRERQRRDAAQHDATELGLMPTRQMGAGVERHQNAATKKAAQEGEMPTRKMNY